MVVERGVNPKERLKKLMIYSQPMSDGRRALVLRLNQTVLTHFWWKTNCKKCSSIYTNSLHDFQEEDKEEMKEILEMKRTHIKNVEKLKLRNQNNQMNHQKEKDKTIL